MYQLAIPGTGVALEEMVEKAVLCLQTFVPPNGEYWTAYSGGKDSDVIAKLCEMAGVSHTLNFYNTGLEAPELYAHVRKRSDVVWHAQRLNLYDLCRLKKRPPTAVARYCCDYLKEATAPDGARVVTGVRGAESPRRAKKWKQVLKLKARGSRTHTLVNPIFYWDDATLWEFVDRYKVEVCSLYDDPQIRRLGCVGCPMGRPGNEWEFDRWPRHRKMWKRAVFAAWQAAKDAGKLEETEKWPTPEAMWDWWLNGRTNAPSEICDGFGLFV